MYDVQNKPFTSYTWDHDYKHNIIRTGKLTTVVHFYTKLPSEMCTAAYG